MKRYPTQKEREEYNKKEKTCPICGQKFFESYTKYTLSAFCSRKCSCTYSSKLKREERNKKISSSLKGRKNIFKGRKKKYPKTYCIICGKELTHKQIQTKNKTCSSKCGNICANKTKLERGTVFVEHGQGRSHSGYWKGFFCNSSYELAYYIYMSEHGYKVERNTKAYEYEWKGKKCLYYPDFRVDGKLVEVKGYWSPRVQTKLNAITDEDITILYYKDLEPMMCWVDSKYNTRHSKKSNDYWKLYDNSKPIYRYKYTCDICGKEFETNTYRKPGKWKYIVCSMKCKTESKKFNSKSPLV